MSSPVTLNDATKAVVNYRLNNLHTALPGSIISYDFSTQKASIQPLLNKVWTAGSNSTPANDNAANKLTTPMPVLNNVPVIFPRSGGAGLTFPVNSGDTCLLIFVERSMDLWKSVGGQVSPDDNRKFDLSDAVAIMGLFPFNENSTAQNNTDVVLTYKDSSITISGSGNVVIATSGKVAIGNSTTELLSIISQLLADLQGPAVTGVSLGGPLNPTFVAQALALQTQIDLIKGTIT